VRTLEKGAHLRRNLRGFPRCALSNIGEHLRRGCAPSAGLALHPVPLTHGDAQALASALVALFGQNSLFFRSCVKRPLGGRLRYRRAIPARRESRPHSGPSASLPQALDPLGGFVSMREGPAGKKAAGNKKSRAFVSGTAPHGRDLQVTLYRILLVSVCDPTLDFVNMRVLRRNAPTRLRECPCKPSRRRKPRLSYFVTSACAGIGRRCRPSTLFSR
jgi:hypothetical protein